MHSLHDLDRVEVNFDDDHAVADAGLVLPATLAQHLGLEAAADALVGVGYRPGRKTLTLVHALLAGADCIDDADLLRAGSTERVLGHEVVAPSTLGTWLRQFTFGHVRQLDRLTEALLTRAWAAGARPGDAPLVIDIDSTVVEVHGYAKQGAGYGYTRQLGYHPLLATRADTGEVLHIRMRKGSANAARGAQRFVRETTARVGRAGATGPILLRADSGFWSHKTITACRDHQVRFSITVRQTSQVRDTIDAIAEPEWVDIAYTAGGQAQVAETRLGDHRLVVRRTRLVGAQQEALFPDWRHYAVVELAIRDLKQGSGLNHWSAARSWPRPSAAATSPSRAGSPAPPAATSSTYPATGPGTASSTPHSRGCVPCPR